MRRSRTAAVAALAGGVVTAALLTDESRRRHLARSARVWGLTGRRGADWLAVKAVGRTLDAGRRAELEERFVIRSAEDVARELGDMKGVIMKAGQLVSFIAEGLPEEAQQALASLQADAPPMAPSLAESVIEAELGAPARTVFLDWDPEPAAAASIGQVHRAVLRDGRRVAVKVQYPGIDDAVGSDLENAEKLYGLFSSFALHSLDVEALVDELRQRITDELDYRGEALRQQAFAERYDGHPFISVPSVIPELSTGRVLTSEWVDGRTWDDFLEHADDAQRQKAGEVLFRFAQGSIYRHRTFNGDPHPGNYRFHDDGSITFLDFGLVKAWTDDEVDSLWPLIDPLLAADVDETIARMIDAGFLVSDHGLDPERVFDFVASPYLPYRTDEFTFTRTWVAETLATIIDVTGPHREVVAKLNLPSSFVILDRVVWGMSALLGRLGATNRWRAILAEYRTDAAPATELGELEQTWLASRPKS